MRSWQSNALQRMNKKMVLDYIVLLMGVDIVLFLFVVNVRRNGGAGLK